MGVLAVGFVIVGGVAIARWYTVARLREQNQALVLKLAAAKQERAYERERADNLAAFTKASAEQQQCTKDSEQLQRMLEVARANIGPCPTNCGSLDCRQTLHMMHGLELCLDFLHKFDKSGNYLENSPAPAPVPVKP
jgi:hypothetical protein